MSQINPFTGSIVQAPQVQRAQAAEKDRQLRKLNDLAKNAALQDDQLQREVESSQAVTPISDSPPQKRQNRRAPARPKRREADSEAGDSGIDLTA